MVCIFPHPFESNFLVFPQNLFNFHKIQTRLSFSLSLLLFHIIYGVSRHIFPLFSSLISFLCHETYDSKPEEALSRNPRHFRIILLKNFYCSSFLGRKNFSFYCMPFKVPNLFVSFFLKKD